MLTSCESKSVTKTDVTSETEIDIETAETETEYPQLELPVTDYNGATVTIMSALVEGTATSTRFAEFFYDEELAGEGVNDAVLERNNIVEELLNVEIVNNDTTGDSIDTALINQTVAGDTSVDIYTPYMQWVLGLITEGYLVDLYTMPVMNIENPWWDTAINRDLGIAGKVFMQGGDILFSSKELHAFLCVNQKILSNHNLEIPYELVFEGKWTLDVMYDMCSELTVDLSGDGILDHNDQIAYTDSPDGSYWLFVDAGGSFVDLNASGELVVNSNMEHNVAVLEKLAKFYGNSNVFLNVEKMPNTWTTNREMFMNDQIAFRSASIYNLQSTREMVSDFGILPTPKYDEQQEDYVNCPTSFRMLTITIPVTNTRLELTGSVLEALAYYSKDTTVEAYYDANLQRKVSRDDESRRVLEIIFSTVTYDLIESYRWGDIFNIVCNNVEDPSSFISQYTSGESAMISDMEKTYTYFVENHS